MESRKILVTGGAGFLGSNLVKRLLSEGHIVTCLDDMSFSMPEHVAAFSDHPRFSFLQQDVRDPIKGDFEQIYNFACPASPPAYQRDPIKTVLTNVLGIKNMLDLARRNGARLVQASTSEVYGDPREHPQRESYQGHVKTMGPRACYDEGKRCAETLIHDHVSQFDVDARVARIFNTYGPGMRPDDGRVVSNFIVQALKGENLTVYGDGRQTRSMCFVDDLIEGLVRLMACENVDVHPVNLGNPREMMIVDFAKTILAQINSGSQIRYLSAAIDDPHVRCPDITRARDVLGWRPKITLEEGLPHTIRHFADLLGVPVP